MTEENNTESQISKLRKSHAERLQDQSEKIRSETIFNKKKEELKKILRLTDEQRDFAQAMIRLREIPEFKIYNDFAVKLRAETHASAFENPKPVFMDAATTFGEKMAFKKGFHYGELYVDIKIISLVNQYLGEIEAQEKLERKTDENEKKEN